MKKTLSVILSFMAFLNLGFAQTLEKMNWFNEPENWEIKDLTLDMESIFVYILKFSFNVKAFIINNSNLKVTWLALCNV